MNFTQLQKIRSWPFARIVYSQGLNYFVRLGNHHGKHQPKPAAGRRSPRTLWATDLGRLVGTGATYSSQTIWNPTAMRGEGFVGDLCLPSAKASPNGWTKLIKQRPR